MAERFTTPVEQRLYVIRNMECGAAHLNNWGTTTLAVVDQDIVVLRAVIEDGTTSLWGIFDLDRDGKNEVMVRTDYSNNGMSITQAALYRFGRGELVTVRRFEDVETSNCGGAPAGVEAKSQWLVIVAHTTKDGALQFSQESRSAPCE